MARRCTCDATDRCKLCWLYHNDPKYRAHWDDPASATASPPAAKLPIRLDCVHRGPQKGEVSCQSCGGNVRVKTFACDLHGECTLEKDVGVKVCATCCDYRPPQAGP